MLLLESLHRLPYPEAKTVVIGSQLTENSKKPLKPTGWLPSDTDKHANGQLPLWHAPAGNHSNGVHQINIQPKMINSNTMIPCMCISQSKLAIRPHVIQFKVERTQAGTIFCSRSKLRTARMRKTSSFWNACYTGQVTSDLFVGSFFNFLKQK